MSSDSTTTTTPLHSSWSVREASGVDDAYYLMTKWHHYFDAAYDDTQLPPPLAEVAGWIGEDDPDVEAYGVIATHHPRGRDGSVDVGGGLVSIIDHEQCVEDLPDGHYSKSALAGQRNAWLWFGTVDPAFRGRGIGRALFEARLEWATAHGADMVFALGWERRNGRTSRPLFEANDFVEIPIHDGYYEGMRESCPDCGAWPNNDVVCECDAVLWARDGS
jgi:GNAT superfamily N-acetyltransferase